MAPIKLILIDFDDTLCLTEENGFHLENEVASSFGFKSQSRLIHQKTWGKPLPEVADIRFPGIDISKFMEAVGKTMALKASKLEFDVISSENIATLLSLKRDGYLLGIVTSRTNQEISHLIGKSHQLMSVLSPNEVFGKERTVFGKPDPRVFDVPLAFYQCLPHNSIYVGDSVSDAIAAKKAGLGSIISTESKLRSERDFPSLLVDSYISRFSDLTLAIKQVTIGKMHLSPSTVSNLLKDKSLSVPHDLLSQNS